MKMLLLAAALALPHFAPHAVLAVETPLEVDLHFHPFMDDGMGAFFKGGPDEPLEATKWNDRWASKANFETLEQSGVRLAVVSLFVHPAMVTRPRESLRRQIATAQEFASRSGWVIASRASEAQAALSEGKRVMVLSVERLSWAIETEADLEEFIDRGRISIATFLHLTDDDFGGVALLRGFRALSSPLALAEWLFHPIHDDQGVPINPNGLTRRGRELARKLIARGVWLDLTHASDRSQLELIPMLDIAGHPLLYTHTALRRYLPVERGISNRQLREVARSRGMIGLVPSEELLDMTPASETACGLSHGGLPALVRHYNAAVAELGAGAVAIGSDFNAPSHSLRPSCETGTSLDGEAGFWNMAQLPELGMAMAGAGARLPKQPGATLERFLEAWSKVR